MSCNKEICFYSNWSWDLGMEMSLNIRVLPRMLTKLKLALSNLQTFGTQVNMSVIRVNPDLGLESLCHVTRRSMFLYRNTSLLSKQESEGSLCTSFCDSKLSIHLFSFYVCLICCKIEGRCDEFG